MRKDLEFKDILRAVTTPPGSDPATVIGGQAVNYWCDLVSAESPELAKYRPFTSIDLDVVAQRKEQTFAIATALKLKVVEAEQSYASTDRAALVDGNRTVVQVLGGMYGVSDSELKKQTADVSFEIDGEERHAKVANRIALIKGKLALVLAPDGVRSPENKEHDLHHLRLLIICASFGTRDLIANPQLTERFKIESLKQLLKVIKSKAANEVSSLHSSIDFKKAIFPTIAKLDAKKFPKLRAYVDNEILPWLTGKASKFKMIQSAKKRAPRAKARKTK